MIMRSMVLTAAGLAALAGSVAAQACLGLPTRDGQLALTAFYAPVDGGSEFGGEFTADVSGPASFGVGYRNGDPDREGYFGRVAYDFYLVEPAVCAVAGVDYLRNPSDAVDDRLAVPVGLGIGKTLRYTAMSATVYAVPQYAWVQETRSVLGSETTETTHAFLGEAGVTLGFTPFHVGGAVILSSLSGEDPSFRIRAGVRF